MKPMTEGVLISDPAFLALSGHQLARLALVVTRVARPSPGDDITGAKT